LGLMRSMRLVWCNRGARIDFEVETTGNGPNQSGRVAV
jgi:hypothetical protein